MELAKVLLGRHETLPTGRIDSIDLNKKRLSKKKLEALQRQSNEGIAAGGDSVHFNDIDQVASSFTTPGTDSSDAECLPSHMAAQPALVSPRLDSIVLNKARMQAAKQQSTLQPSEPPTDSPTGAETPDGKVQFSTADGSDEEPEQRKPKSAVLVNFLKKKFTSFGGRTVHSTDQHGPHQPPRLHRGSADTRSSAPAVIGGRLSTVRFAVNSSPEDSERTSAASVGAEPREGSAWYVTAINTVFHSRMSEDSTPPRLEKE